MPDKSKPSPTKPTAPPLKALTEESVGTLHPDDSVQTAGIRMRDHDTCKWPVAQDQKLVGMIDQKNPDWQTGGHGHDPKTSTVGEIMSREVVFCYEDEDCSHAQRVMEDRGLSYLPVVDREMRVVGIYSREEIQAKVQASVEDAASTED